MRSIFPITKKGPKYPPCSFEEIMGDSLGVKILKNEYKSCMGTNFYLRRKIPDQKIYELCNMMWDGKYEAVRNFLSSEDSSDIHIGKRSYGWRFLWDHNNFKYFDPTVESIHEFLKSGWIVDEYDEVFTFDQFLEDEIKYNLENGIILREHYIAEKGEDYLKSFELERGTDDIKEELIKHLRRNGKEEFFKQLNFDETGEFSIGNYRFSGFTDFS